LARTVVITGCSTGFGRLAAPRPFRSVVGSDFGVVRELNRVVEPLYDQLNEGMGLVEITRIEPEL